MARPNRAELVKNQLRTAISSLEAALDDAEASEWRDVDTGVQDAQYILKASRRALAQVRED